MCVDINIYFFSLHALYRLMNIFNQKLQPIRSWLSVDLVAVGCSTPLQVINKLESFLIPTECAKFTGRGMPTQWSTLNKTSINARIYSHFNEPLAKASNNEHNKKQLGVVPDPLSYYMVPCQGAHEGIERERKWPALPPYSTYITSLQLRYIAGAFH